MLKIVVRKDVDKALEKLHPKHAAQVSNRIGGLIGDPFPPDSKQLKRSSFRSVDVGEYRVIYAVVGDILYVPIVGKRNDGDVYRRLRRLEG